MTDGMFSETVFLSNVFWVFLRCMRTYASGGVRAAPEHQVYVHSGSIA